MIRKPCRLLLGLFFSSFIALSLVSCLSSSALAVGPRAGGNAAVVDNMIPQSVHVGDERGFFASGTVISPNTVLTCAHCVDSGFLLGGGLAFQSHANQFRTISGAGTPANPRVFGAPMTGLAIVHPNFDFQNVGMSDMALIISPTPIALPGGAAPATVVAGADGLANGSVITFAGFGGAASLPAPPPGLGNGNDRLRGSSPVTGLTANQINFSVVNPPGMGPNNVATQYTEPGDSGGGYFAQVGGNTRVVGVHNAGNSRNLNTNPNLSPITFQGARITGPNFNTFARGNGVSAADRTGLIISWNINGNGNFNSNNWMSNVGGITTPATGHVAVVRRGGANPVVSVTADSPLLYGLVNDDTINVTGGRLRVTHTARSAGVLNGPNGTITVQANRELETTALDNQGMISVNAAGRLTARADAFNNGTLTINGAVGNTRARGDFSGPNGLRNAMNVNVTGGAILQTTAYTNIMGATTTLTNGTLDTSNRLNNAGMITSSGGLTTVGGDLINSGTIGLTNTANRGRLIANDDATNTGTINVGPGALGRFADQVTNGATAPMITPGMITANGRNGGMSAQIDFNDDVINNPGSTITASNGGLINFNSRVANLDTAARNRPAKIVATGLTGANRSTINFAGEVGSADFVGDFEALDGGRLDFAQSLTIGRGGVVNSLRDNGGVASSVSINGDLRVRAFSNATVGNGALMTAKNVTIDPAEGTFRVGRLTVFGAGSSFTATSTNNGGEISIFGNGNANLGPTINRKGATIQNKGRTDVRFIENRGRYRKDPSLTFVEEFFEFTGTGTIDGDGEIFIGGDWLNRSNRPREWDMTEIDLIFDDDPLSAGDAPEFNDSLLITPSLDLLDPSFDGPVLFLDSLSMMPGNDLMPSVLDVRGGRLYVEGDLNDPNNFFLSLDTAIIDSVNPSRDICEGGLSLACLSGPDPIVRMTSFLPTDNFAIRSLQVAGQDLVFLQRHIIPEPSGLMLLIIAIACLLKAELRKP